GEAGELSYRPPGVVKLTGFGTASSESTVGLPGRWLVGEVQRNPGDIVSTLLLVQPTKPLKEPAHELETTAAGAAAQLGQPGQPETVIAAVQAAKRLSEAGVPYLWAGGHKSGSELDTISKAGYDCSGSVSWVLKQAGFPPPAGGNWGGGAADSTAFESWG